MTPIAAYLEELSGMLARGSRRRILAEVDAHLQEAAALGCARGEAAEVAERVAVARFGAPTEVARQFNSLRRSPSAIGRRVLAIALASAATGGVGTATVWAFGPSSHAHAAHHGRIATRRDR